MVSQDPLHEGFAIGSGYEGPFADMKIPSEKFALSRDVGHGFSLLASLNPSLKFVAVEAFGEGLLELHDVLAQLPILGV
jgi:hypothetical protein